MIGIKQLRESARDDFTKLQNGEKAGELRQLVNEFRKTLGT